MHRYDSIGSTGSTHKIPQYRDIIRIQNETITLLEVALESKTPTLLRDLHSSIQKDTEIRHLNERIQRLEKELREKEFTEKILSIGGGEDPSSSSSSSSLPLSSPLSSSKSESDKSVYSSSVNTPVNMNSIENIENSLIRSDSSSFLIPGEKGMDKECSAKYGKFDIYINIKL